MRRASLWSFCSSWLCSCAVSFQDLFSTWQSSSTWTRQWTSKMINTIIDASREKCLNCLSSSGVELLWRCCHGSAAWQGNACIVCWICWNNFFCTRFSHLLLIFNASVNFLIYCSLNNNFKAEMRKVCSKLYNKYKVGTKKFLYFFCIYFWFICKF